MDEGFTTIDGSSSDGLGSLQPSIIPSNVPLLSAFLAFSLAQFLKLFTTWYKEKRWDPRRLVRSGGMPSSHSATVSALAVAIGFQEGSGGSAFAVAVVLAFIVMFDASGVRLHAGRQAELLNQIVCELPPEHPVSSVRPLRDSLGHTPVQVDLGLGLLPREKAWRPEGKRICVVTQGVKRPTETSAAEAWWCVRIPH
ncbi:uncharacterized protein LOC116145296 isoform X1 [Pistacia vera]|uniref:uncharacterized protein LOC116145296 isoform X1 n=1 Tax=Pistacia vera TaxID=55513 RepID=UPI001262FB74|nr:uncharacterized protein LOC116145296 isoform X1 [Pistacia vera]